MNRAPSSIRPYLEEIAQCLWNKNASIMIGAGFSMNAEAVFENAKPFPLWQDLGNIFYKKVRGEEIKDAKYRFFDPLKLAYEVESNFGRPVLDSILRESIPDSEYKPSTLHQSLLSLPWTDVFTTNYDTLLERAADLVNERNYKVVVNKDNLIHSASPRIVKLHGCFSASTPLIISEEDYRTYPQKYAPFVNTVQQTLLENTLCLIGFSGDDPNFLKWIGWIRDNLGEKNSPKIYLIGTLNLSSSQEKALSQYNITCVDMSQCENIGKKDHHAGIKAFVDYCESRREDENHIGWKLSRELIYPANSASPEEITNQLTGLISSWREERCLYPNWLVAPYDLRQKLWAHTKQWSSILNSEVDIPFEIFKNFVYEFLWRKEKSLCPIFDNEVNKISSSLNLYLEDIATLDSKALYIALSLLRYYREEGKRDDWEKLFKTVKGRFTQQNESDHFIYEEALFLLFDNKNKELTNLLSNWVSGSSSAIWMYRKASILAEINKIPEAQEILEKALVKIRRKINSTSSISDFSNVSLESYILVLLNYVNNAMLIQKGQFLTNYKEGYLERLDDLKQYQCNPLQEIQLLEFEIKHEPSYPSGTSISNGFDIGTRHTTRHFSFENNELLNAFRLLRFFEDAALPFSLPGINIAVSGANHAIKRTAKHAPYWSMCTMLRTRDKKSIELIFTRESLYSLNTHFIDDLAKKYISLLGEFINGDDSLYEYGLVLPEALSRLCCRLTLAVRDQILDLTQRIYDNQPSYSRFQSIDNLVKRLMFSYSNIEHFERIDKITTLAYSVIRNEGRDVDRHLCKNPFNYLDDLSAPIIEHSKHEVKIPHSLIKQILYYASSNNLEIRNDATFILIQLNEIRLLNKNQIKSLLSKLLYHTDAYGLPNNTIYFKFAYLSIFNENSGIEQAFRAFIHDLSPLIQTKTINPQSYAMSGCADKYTRELIGSTHLIKWNNDELHSHAQKLLNWWEADKTILEKNKDDGDISSEIRLRFSNFVESIYLIIFKNNLYQYRDIVKSIIHDCKEMKFNYLNLKAASIGFIEFDSSSFGMEIDDALSSLKKQDTIDALRAMYRLLSSQTVEPIYVNIFSTFIRYSRGHYLIHAFRVLIDLLNSDYFTFEYPLEHSILRALHQASEVFEDLDFEENLELKKFAAELASDLKSYYLTRQLEVPSVIAKWEDICTSNETFAEIRNRWVNR